MSGHVDEPAVGSAASWACGVDVMGSECAVLGLPAGRGREGRSEAGLIKGM